MIIAIIIFVFFYILRKASDVHYENYGSYSGTMENTKICSSCGKKMNETYRGEKTPTICTNCR
ncbi:hypothetical protein CR194_09275 [Salipaludibacillus keqinensis]|uniref:Uncharacterized protein n=1 Tax=Salipaludibacillus keqinensis TaxID=2045207 RepID=A0A323TEF4_9BACI|nr:hypothetical protein CR194_09275 [Salipaludibacillus keqinensis]